MKHQFLPLLILLSLLFAACGGSPEESISKNGISFTKPAGWKISEEEYTDEANTLFLEKEGFAATGLVLVQWYPEQLDPGMLVDIYVESFGAAEDVTNFERVPTVPAEINGAQGASAQYSFRATGMPCSGRCICFPCGSITVLVAAQGAEEDKESNDPGFKAIEKSIRCE